MTADTASQRRPVGVGCQKLSALEIGGVKGSRQGGELRKRGYIDRMIRLFWALYAEMTDSRPPLALLNISGKPYKCVFHRNSRLRGSLRYQRGKSVCVQDFFLARR